MAKNRWDKYPDVKPTAIDVYYCTIEHTTSDGKKRLEVWPLWYNDDGWLELGTDDFTDGKVIAWMKMDWPDPYMPEKE